MAEKSNYSKRAVFLFMYDCVYSKNALFPCDFNFESFW